MTINTGGNSAILQGLLLIVFQQLLPYLCI